MKYIILAVLFTCALGAQEPRWVMPRLPLNLILSGKFPMYDDNARIVGGTVVSPHSLPFQAMLERSNALGVFSLSCGGSIIDTRTILCAAHCTTPLGSLSTYRIVAGEHDRNTDENTEQIRSVSKITNHASYNADTFANDISLIFLSTALNYNAYVNEINLGTSVVAAGTTLTVSGWGTTSSGGSISAQLRSVDVPVVSDSSCASSYPNSIIASTMLCAGTTGKDSCQGDSGGPLWSKSGSTFTQHGIVSWGYGCAAAGYPGVYTEVQAFVSWINNNNNP